MRGAVQTASHINRRGVYGQNDGSLQRGGKDSAAANFGEWQADAATSEGRETATLARMFKEQDWTGFQNYANELRRKGFAGNVVDRMVASATRGRI